MHTARHKKGQAMSVIVFGTAFLIIGVIGMFAFNVARTNMAREQLKAACQAAAVAGAASMASSDDKDTLNMHSQALLNAMTVFRQNHVMGKSLSQAEPILTPPVPVPGKSCTVFMEILDPNNGYSPVSLGNAKGKIFRVTACYGLEPAFGAYSNIGPQSLISTGTAGVPMMDIVVVFDVSGSIDDQTPVTMVRRIWDGLASPAKIAYQTASGGSGIIFDMMRPPATGTGFNATPPQSLSAAGSGGSVTFSFSEGSGTYRGLRGASDHTPPGNKPGVLSKTVPSPPSNSRVFTDTVVNIDGNKTFGGFSADGYSFPNVGTLVEAQRGNLENDTVFTESGAKDSLSSTGVSAKAGYKAKYLELAKKVVEPIHSAQDAAQTFFTIMNNDTNAHFGFVAFSTNAGYPSNPNTFTEWEEDSSWTPAGKTKQNFEIPIIQLDPAQRATNYNQISAKIPVLTANGSTNIGDALNTAVKMMKSNSRKTSKKAIVLFTDGQPTSGGPLNSDPWTNARKAAVEAKKEGIPIYAIGLAQNEAIIPKEKEILNDWNPDPASGGVAAIAGHGGRFFLVNNHRYLRQTFQNLAREFVQMVKNW